MSRLQAKSFRRKAAAASHHSHGKAHHHGRPRWPACRLMDSFRKMLVGLFSFPPQPPTVTFSVDEHHHVHSGRSGGGGDAPKRSCSSNLHPLNAHYDEAIADCVEFFNKSARVDVRSRPHF